MMLLLVSVILTLVIAFSLWRHVKISRARHAVKSPHRPVRRL